MVSRVWSYSFAILIRAFYFSSGSITNRIATDVGNHTKCEKFDNPNNRSIFSLRNVTLDQWPWNCLNMRYNSSLDDLVSNYSSDIFDAASNGYLGFVQYYTEIAHISLSPSKDGQTPLHLAVKNGSLPVVKYIATKVTPSDLNAPDYERTTPLLYALLLGQQDIVRYLLTEAKVDSLYDENDRENVLKMAAKGGNLDTLKYLIRDRGYKVRADDQELLLAAASGGNTNLIIYLMYEHNLTKMGTNRKGDTALHVAASKGRLEAAKFFVEALRYRVNVLNLEDAIPAHSAAQGGSLCVLRYLIEKRGADLNARNGYGDSLLHLAAQYGHLPIVEYLVSRLRMNVELRDYMSRTPLHRAVLEDHMNVVRYLACVKRADLSSKDKEGRNLLHQAVLCGSIDMIKYLVDDMNMVDRVNEVDPLWHRSAALEAAHWGRLTILKFLMDHQQTKTWIVDSEGKNLLHIAARQGHLEIVKYLIEKRSFDVNARCPDGLTAYNFAAMFEEDTSRKRLLEYLYNRINSELSTER